MPRKPGSPAQQESQRQTASTDEADRYLLGLSGAGVPKAQPNESMTQLTDEVMLHLQRLIDSLISQPIRFEFVWSSKLRHTEYTIRFDRDNKTGWGLSVDVARTDEYGNDYDEAMPVEKAPLNYRISVAQLMPKFIEAYFQEYEGRMTRLQSAKSALEESERSIVKFVSRVGSRNGGA